MTKELHGKLEEIFEFLILNHRFNEQVQYTAYRQDILPWPDTGSKLRSMLYSKAYTQSAPQLDPLMETWKKFNENIERFNLVRSVVELNEALWQLVGTDCAQRQHDISVFEKMWVTLKNVKGFGEKTAALFVKSIVDIHTLPINENLRFLDDFSIDTNDRLMIPVDRVIMHIFASLGLKKASFSSINKLITESQLTLPERPTLWDDLWFWGFITQKKNGNGHESIINEAKFWSILGAPVNDWDQIKVAAEEFRQLVKPLH